MTIKQLLNQALLYDIFKYIIGPQKTNKLLVDEYIQPSSNGKVLDIGCGTGTIRHYLPRSVQYTGIDINEIYINAAQNELKDKARFIYGDITSLGSMDLQENSFDIILALGLIHHLNNSQAQKVFHDSFRLLKGGGVIVTLDGVYDPQQSWIAKYILSQDRGKFVRTLDGYLALVGSDKMHVESFVRHDLLRIPYSHCILRITKV